MDIEVMQAEAVISEFISTFLGLAKDSSSGMSDTELAQFEALMNVTKTVYIAQLSITKLLGSDIMKDLDE